MAENRTEVIDFIKGTAVIAVVLYHLGILPNGYLGVDVFLVVNGYLIMKSIFKDKNGVRDFSFFGFMVKRIIRLWPVLLAGCILTMLLGYFVMLPDDYEGLAETVVASAVGSNNILQAITTHNYWDAVQDYKPLMHTWYLGVVMQFYVLYGIYTTVVCKCCKDNQMIYTGGMIVLTLISFILYIIPGDPSDKFYYLQYRFWELGLGVVLAIAVKEEKIKLENNSARKIIYGSISILVILMLLPYKESVKIPSLIIMVACSIIVLFASSLCQEIKMMKWGGVLYVGLEHIVTVYT